MATTGSPITPYAPGTGAFGRFEVGQVISGRFAVVRYIARGGMGEVYEVEDRYLQGVHVALKVISPQAAGDEGSSHRFEREVLLARKVIHPNLCPIYDLSRCEDTSPPFLFLTMKLLSGETLACRLQRAPLIRNEVALLFHQLIAGLSALHAAGVVHGDIKPNNVMLDESGPELCASIMDFGLARLFDPQTTALTRGTIAGTPGYIALEILRGGRPSQATDLYALGVLFLQALTADPGDVQGRGAAMKSTADLDGADAPPEVVHCVKEFLSDDPQRRCDAFRKVQRSFGSSVAVTDQESINRASETKSSLLTRRNFVMGSAAAACVATGGIYWKRQGIYNVLHPLPPKRFVAILDWPPVDARVKDTVMGLIDAMASELSRAEVFDHNFFITAPRNTVEMKTAAEVNEVRESLGANLVLATSSVPSAKGYRISLQVLPQSSTAPLRTDSVHVETNDQASLPGKVVRAAARLLDIIRYEPQDKRIANGTTNPEALAAFQAAEALVKLPNFKGFEAAIDKYKQAVELDPRYALAYARLAMGYLRFYDMKGEAGLTRLARENAERSLTLDRDLVEGHLALASVLQGTGDSTGALREFRQALALDPSNPRTLTYQGQLYAKINRWDDAEKNFLRVLKERPNYWLAYNELGMNYNSQGNYPKALESFRASSMAAPKDYWALSNVASLCFQLGRFDEAIDTAKKSMALEPNDVAAGTMADVLRAQQKYEESLSWALEAKKINPIDSLNWLEVGDSYSKVRGHAAESAEAYKGATRIQQQRLETDPSKGPDWMLLALYLVKVGRPEGAMALVLKADSLNAADMYSQLYKVRILELLGAREQALGTLEACVKRGATSYQLDAMVDLEALRRDPRGVKIISSYTRAA